MDKLPFDLETIRTMCDGILATFAAIFGYRDLRRGDKKADVIEDGYQGVIENLKAEVGRLEALVTKLIARVEGCEGERFKLQKIIAGFEARYGTRRTDKAAM